MTTASSPLFKLGVHRLPAAESVLVRTILWFYSFEEDCRWAYTDTPPYDAVLIDASHGPEAAAEAQELASKVLSLTGIHGEPAAHRLQRPITAEKLRLRLLEIQTLQTAPRQATAVVAQVRAETEAESEARTEVQTQTEVSATPDLELELELEPLPPLADTDFAPLMPALADPHAAAPAPERRALVAHAPASAPTTPAPAPAPVPIPVPAPTPAVFAALPAENEETPSPELPIDALRQRLKRWPRAAILRGDPQRVRMAALLSRRALNGHDLMRITGFSAATCQIFLQVLQSSDLLSCEPSASSPADLPPATAPAVTVTEAQPAALQASFTRSLIAGFRRRLGL